jgi:sodium-dependent phosphate cotransporter
VLGAVCSLGVFLFAIRLLGSATEAAAIPLEQFFRRSVTGHWSTLGLSWLATYAVANGSAVAALSVSLFEAGILTPLQLFLMVAGSRLGSAAIVLLVGGLDYLQEGDSTFGEATSLGLLTFLLTHSIYVPATIAGVFLLPWLRRWLAGVSTWLDLSVQPLSIFAPVIVPLLDAVGPGPALVVALLSLLGSLSLFDHVLDRIDTEWLRDRFFRRLQHKWMAFGLGVLVTGLFTSVAFSLGVVVPLYNRGYVTRREIIPYVLGANIGTLVDTVLVAVLLKSPEGVAVVLSLLLVGAALTVCALLCSEPYFAAVETVQRRLVTDRRALAGFLLALVLVPLLLVLFQA